MKRETSLVRPDWQKKVEEIGFDFHHIDGKPYWIEHARYHFSTAEIDVLEAATADLHGVCMKAVQHVIDNKLWARLKIPEAWGSYIADTWRRGDPSLVGRFDLAFDGNGPPKMLEYNADTPTALYEAGVVQWYWLKEVLPEADQFNSIHEKLVAGWTAIAKMLPKGATVHFARSETQIEDLATSEYLRDCCVQAGLQTETLTIENIGWNGRRFTDLQEMPIQAMSKLYPWEWMAREKFGQHVLADTTAFMEPAWKMILSNKALLPLLWEGFPGHPNLLPAYDTPDSALGERYVRKPVFGREGANVALIGGGLTAQTPGTYGEEGYIYQQYAPLPVFEGNPALIGSWIVGGEPAGIGVREDDGPITHNDSRFVPHWFD